MIPRTEQKSLSIIRCWLSRPGSGVMGLEKATYWMPPFYFIVLGGTFRLLGFSRFWVQMWSFVPAMLVVLLVWLIALKLSGSKWAAVLGAVCCATDGAFVRAAKSNRMDAFALLLMTLGILGAVSALQTATPRRSVILLLLGGIFLGLGVSTYPLAVAGVLCATVLVVFWRVGPLGRPGSLALLWLGVGFGAAVWGAWIARNPALFHAQFFGNLHTIGRHGVERSWTHAILNPLADMMASYRYAPHVILVGLGATCWLAARTKEYRVVFVACVVLSLLFLWNRNALGQRYSVYAIVLIWPAAGWAMWEIPKSTSTSCRWRRVAGLGLIAAVLSGQFANGSATRYYALVRDWRYRNHAAYARQLREIIPSGANVLAAPEAYYGLREAGCQVFLSYAGAVAADILPQIEYVVAPPLDEICDPQLRAFLIEHTVAVGQAGECHDLIEGRDRGYFSTCYRVRRTAVRPGPPGEQSDVHTAVGADESHRT